MTNEAVEDDNPGTDAAVAGTARKRGMVGMFVAVAAMSTSMAGTSTAGTLIAAEAVGEGWSGSASAFGIAGTAIGSLLTSRVMAARGRRTGLRLAFALATVAAVVALFGAALQLFGVLLIGLVGIGIGNSGGQLARYVAAELHEPRRSGTALSVIVWAGTVGAVLGPSLIAPTAGVAHRVGLPDLSGAFVLAMLLIGVAALASGLLPRMTQERRPDPASQESRAVPTGPSVRPFGHPVVRTALAAMVAGQVAMVAVMAMTPVHLHHQGEALGMTGAVLSAHMLGMFALAPISGRLADRFGGIRVIIGGVGTLLLSTVLAAVAPLSTAGLSIALFLLGYGWNLCFVGGSSLLSGHLGASDRTRLQGRVDGIVWGSSAVASLLSGRLLEWGDYSFVAMVAGVVAVVPVVFALRRA